MDPENQDRPRLPETPPDPIQGTFPISDEWINAAKKEGRQEHTFLTSLYPAEPTSSAWKAPVPASILWHGSLSRGTVRLSVLSSSFTLEADLAVVRKTILDHLAAQGRIFTDTALFFWQIGCCNWRRFSNGDPGKSFPTEIEMSSARSAVMTS